MHLFTTVDLWWELIKELLMNLYVEYILIPVMMGAERYACCKKQCTDICSAKSRRGIIEKIVTFGNSSDQ